MSRVLLAVPPMLSKIKYPPIGMGYLAAVAREQGHDVEIFDFNAEFTTKKRFEGKLKEFCPDFVGVTSVTANYHLAADIIGHVRQVQPQATIIMGGPHVTFVPEEALLQDGVDYVVRFEGEETFCELLDVVSEGGDTSKVEGIAYLDDGVVTHTSSRHPIRNLDSIPFPARDLLNLRDYHIHTRGAMLTSRGCVNRCAFCSGAPLQQRGYRQRSPKNLIEELEILLFKYGVTFVQFVDDNFAASRRRIEELCHLISDRDLTFYWGCHLRVNEADPELLKLMGEAGCRSILYGLESCTQAVLDTIHKNTNVEQNHLAIEHTMQNGILAGASFIVGLPGETVESFQKIIKFINTYDVTQSFFNPLIPFPGSPIAESPEKYGIKILHRDWAKYTESHIVAHPENISPETLRDLREKGEYAFYRRNADKIFVKRNIVQSGRTKEGGLWVVEKAQKRKYVFNKMGLFIWNLLDQEQSIREIIRKAQDKLGTTDERISQDIVTFLRRLDGNNLIFMSNHMLNLEREGGIA